MFGWFKCGFGVWLVKFDVELCVVFLDVIGNIVSEIGLMFGF